MRYKRLHSTRGVAQYKGCCTAHIFLSPAEHLTRYGIRGVAYAVSHTRCRIHAPVAAYQVLFSPDLHLLSAMFEVMPEDEHGDELLAGVCVCVCVCVSVALEPFARPEPEF